MNLLVPLAFVAGAASILIGLLVQVWVPAIQLRRFGQIFANRPELAVEAYNRVLTVYGWRARLAVRLFKIPPPGGSG